MPGDSPSTTLAERLKRAAESNVVIATLVVLSAVSGAVFALVSGVKSAMELYCTLRPCVTEDEKKNDVLLEHASTLGDAVGLYIGYMAANTTDPPPPARQIEYEELAKAGVTNAYVAIGLQRADVESYVWTLGNLDDGITRTPGAMRTGNALEISFPHSDAAARLYFRVAVTGCSTLLHFRCTLQTYGDEFAEWRTTYEHYLKDGDTTEQIYDRPCLTVAQLHEHMKAASAPRGKSKKK